MSGGPDYAGKPRPVLIVQADGFDAIASVLVCLITSAPDDLPLARPRLKPTVANGLLAPSRAMTDKLTAVSRARLGRRIGQLEPVALAEVEHALLSAWPDRSRGQSGLESPAPAAWPLPHRHGQVAECRACGLYSDARFRAKGLTPCDILFPTRSTYVPRWPMSDSIPAPPTAPAVTLSPVRAQWTPAKQRIFLAALLETGSVARAARAAGMSRSSAHRLRVRLSGTTFDRLWDHALAAHAQRMADPFAHEAQGGVSAGQGRRPGAAPAPRA